MFSVEPILDLTFFRSGMGAAAAAARGAGERVFSEPGDLGVERTTATFFTLLASEADTAWLAGDLGVPGLLCPLLPSETQKNYKSGGAPFKRGWRNKHSY